MKDKNIKVLSSVDSLLYLYNVVSKNTKVKGPKTINCSRKNFIILFKPLPSPLIFALAKVC